APSPTAIRRAQSGLTIPGSRWRHCASQSPRGRSPNGAALRGARLRARAGLARARSRRARARRLSGTRDVTASSLSKLGRALRRHVPHDHVVVRLRHARVARVENDVYVIGALTTDLQIAERLLSVHVLEWDHVDGAHQVALVVVGEKRPRGQRGGIDIQRAETGDEIGKGGERAGRVVGTAGRRLLLGRCGYGG